MTKADAQVIDMVNAPHEKRVQQKEAMRQAKRRQKNMRKAALELTVKLELYAIAIGLLIIAAGHGWVADWLSTIGVAICIAGGSVELGQHMGR